MPPRVVNRSSRFIPSPIAEKTVLSSDETSLYDSDSSSDDGTLHTVFSDVGHTNNNKYPPQSFGYEKRRPSEDYATEILDQDFHQFASSSSNSRMLSGTAHQLAAALGPDNVLQTTEIDSIPCAGVRIPHGSLKGLLAWRLVVRIPNEGITEQWWKQPEDHLNAATHDIRRRVHSMRILSHPSPRTAKPVLFSSHSASGHTTTKLEADHGNSLASFGRRSFPNIQDSFAPPHPQKKSIALVSNFILDTSIPHSVISRDAIAALGYPLSPRFQKNSDDSSSTVTLSIQGVSTRLSIANHGEASRLGVQFLHDAGVSVFFPQHGDGIGPVLYLESAQLLKDVPSTIGVRERKNTLQRRVKALLGMSFS